MSDKPTMIVDIWWKAVLILGVLTAIGSLMFKVDFIENKHLFGFGLGMVFIGIAQWMAWKTLSQPIFGGRLAELDFIKYVRICDETISALSENYPNRPKVPITKMNHETAIGVQLLYSLSHKYINFYEINSPIKGNGSKMVDAVLNDFPKDWQPTVVMGWSNGFWSKMKEKYKELNWI